MACRPAAGTGGESPNEIGEADDDKHDAVDEGKALAGHGLVPVG